MADLLPSSATAQERALSEAIGRLSAIPVPIDSLWNPNTCPAALLPWLAWVLSVDTWDVSWSVAQKRAIVAASVAVHRVKGTRGALTRAINALGYSIKIVEWFEDDPVKDAFTFRLVIEVDDRGLDDAFYTTLETVVRQAKNVRSHLSGLTIAGKVAGKLHVAAYTMAGDEVTVSPWSIGTRQVNAGFFVGMAAIGYDTVTINHASA